MVFKVTRKDLEKLYNNNEISKILKIYSACASEEEVKILKEFINRDNSDFTDKDLSRFITTIVIKKVRNHNREEEFNSFIPMEKKLDYKTDYLTSDESKYIKSSKNDIKYFVNHYKNNVNSETYIILKQIYNTKKDECYLGLYNIQYDVDLLLEEGIPFGIRGNFTNRIKIINNFDLLLNSISSCDDERQSYGSLIIKIPKKSITSKSEPIYYDNEGTLYLNPKYVVCFVPVKERKLLSVEINQSYNDVESTVYEGEVLEKEHFLHNKYTKGD